MPRPISVNRAAVLTLWAAVVARRLGFDSNEALTLGRAVAGLNAYSKGVKLGLFQPTPAAVREHRRKTQKRGLRVALLHRLVPVKATPDGLRALSGGRPIPPASVKAYLSAKFGGDLARVRRALERLARSRTPLRLADDAWRLYERFRPGVPSGLSGWGARGRLDLGLIARLARQV